MNRENSYENFTYPEPQQIPVTEIHFSHLIVEVFNITSGYTSTKLSVMIIV